MDLKIDKQILVRGMKMKLKILLLLIFFAAAVTDGFARNAAAESKIQIVATTPDLAYFTRRIGGDLVEVKSLATGVEDPHSVPMKPSFAVLLNRADIVVLQGLGLEHAFLPGLLEAARNPKLLPDRPAYIDCSKYVLPLDVPTRVDRSLGEQHPLGNPHFNLDPVNGRNIIRAISDGLALNFPADAVQFQANATALLKELDDWIARWKIEAAPLNGIKFVSFHPDLTYLADRYGMIQVGTIEEKPGVDPTPGHIYELVQLMVRE